MRKVGLGLTVAAAVLGVAIYFRGSDPRVAAMPASTQVPAKAPARHSPEVVLAIAPGNSRPAPVVPSRFSPLMQEYSERKDWRGLHDRLASRSARTAEEDFVLAQLLELCGYLRHLPSMPGSDRTTPDEINARFVASVSAKDPDRAKRIAAYERMSNGGRSCAGFDDIKATPGEIRALLERSAAAGDPKARAQLIERAVFAPFRILTTERKPPLGLPEISDAQMNDMLRAAQSGDPAAIVIAGRVLSSTLGNLVVQGGEGHQPVDPRAFNDAWTLAACEFGLACGADHRTVLESCAHRGNCGAGSLREHMFYYEHSPRQSQLINEYHSHLVTAIRSGDWSWFTFHRGPPAHGSVFFFGRPGP